MIKFQLGKICKVSPEDSESLRQTPLRVALLDFIGLVKHRNQSGSSPQEYIPPSLLREAEKMKGNPNYQPTV